MKIVILGASGRIGGALLYGVRSAFPGAVVVGCTRNPETAEVHGLQTFDPAYDDWSMLGRVDILINAVGIVREVIESDFDRVHGGISSLIALNHESIGAPRIIQISALGADEASPERFFQTKGVADRIVLGTGRATVVRPSIVCTHSMEFVRALAVVRSWIRRMAGILPVPAGGLHTRLQPVMISDVVDVVTALCRTDDHAPVLEVTGTDIYTLRDFLAMIATAEGRRLRTVDVPYALAERALSLLRLVAPSQSVDMHHVRLLRRDSTADHTDACRLLKRPMRSTLPFWRHELGLGSAGEGHNAPHSGSTEMIAHSPHCVP